MTADEFHGTAIRRQSGNTLIRDVRGFNGRQAEAVDFCLREIVEKIEDGGRSWMGATSIAVWCDRGTCFHYSTLDRYRALWRAGFPVKIEEKREGEPD